MIAIGSESAQQKRRGGLTGTKADFALALSYLAKYKSHMDYAVRNEQGDPIGSRITEAICKVIFNQRLKQSGMRWNLATGQFIVDLRTANRSGIWDRVWSRLMWLRTNLPPITRASLPNNSEKPTKKTYYQPDRTQFIRDAIDSETLGDWSRSIYYAPRALHDNVCFDCVFAIQFYPC